MPFYPKYDPYLFGTPGLVDVFNHAVELAIDGFVGDVSVLVSAYRKLPIRSPGAEDGAIFIPSRYSYAAE